MPCHCEDMSDPALEIQRVFLTVRLSWFEEIIYFFPQLNQCLSPEHLLSWPPKEQSLFCNLAQLSWGEGWRCSPVSLNANNQYVDWAFGYQNSFDGSDSEHDLPHSMTSLFRLFATYHFVNQATENTHSNSSKLSAIAVIPPSTPCTRQQINH